MAGHKIMRRPEDAHESSITEKSSITEDIRATGGRHGPAKESSDS